MKDEWGQEGRLQGTGAGGVGEIEDSRFEISDKDARFPKSRSEKIGPGGV
jgi:hypothetical protein